MQKWHRNLLRTKELQKFYTEDIKSHQHIRAKITFSFKIYFVLLLSAIYYYLRAASMLCVVFINGKKWIENFPSGEHHTIRRMDVWYMVRKCGVFCVCVPQRNIDSFWCCCQLCHRIWKSIQHNKHKSNVQLTHAKKRWEKGSEFRKKKEWKNGWKRSPNGWASSRWWYEKYAMQM